MYTIPILCIVNNHHSTSSGSQVKYDRSAQIHQGTSAVTYYDVRKEKPVVPA